MLRDEIKKAMMQAMKDRRNVEKEVLRVALGEIQAEENRRGKDLSDEESEKIVRKLIKSNTESMDNARSDEERQKLELENVTLDGMLPKQLSVDEIVAALSAQADAIKSAAGDGPATGVAMKHLKSIGAAVDGKSVSEAVRKIRG
jgi:uncharacterized protein YqeY